MKNNKVAWYQHVCLGKNNTVAWCLGMRSTVLLFCEPVRGGRKRILTDSQRKKRRLETAQRYASTRIYIGDHISRWREFRKDKDLKCDADVAELLLDRLVGVRKGCSLVNIEICSL